LPLEKVLAADPLILDLASGSRAHRKKQQGRITLDALDLPNIDIVCDLKVDEGVDVVLGRKPLMSLCLCS
jgi:hypothetical protein